MLCVCVREYLVNLFYRQQLTEIGSAEFPARKSGAREKAYITVKSTVVAAAADSFSVLVLGSSVSRLCRAVSWARRSARKLHTRRPDTLAFAVLRERTMSESNHKAN